MKLKFVSACVLGVLSAAAMLSSCADEQAFDVSESCTIVASIEQPAQTRTCVDESNSGQFDIFWSAGDKLGVYSAKSKNKKFTNTNTEAAASASFSGKIAGEPLFAYYPYSVVNDLKPYSEVKGNLPLTQHYSTTDRVLAYDYKVGSPKQDGSGEFAFNHLFALMRFTINATGTAVADEQLDSITLALPAKTHWQGGDFTMNLSSRDVVWPDTPDSLKANVLKLVFDDSPSLANDVTTYGYATCAPIAINGQRITVTLYTTTKKVTFKATLKTDIKGGAAYTFPLSLSAWAKDPNAGFNVGALDGTLVEDDNLKITSLSFNAASTVPTNGDTTEIHSILKRKVYAESTTSHESTTYTDDDASYYNHTATLDGTNFSLYVPYLNSRKLVPTIAYTDGATIQYKNEQGEFVDWDGESAIDFTTYNTLRVAKDNGYKDYTVTFSNTGLPVVVISQPGGDVNWEEVGLTIFSKPSAFPTDGKITFYNADGTIDASVGMSGVRLRGNTTQEFPKKPFAIKLDKKTKVYGMAKHKRWVLLANWKDRTLMRNAVAFGLADIVENAFADGIGWQPSGTFVEVVYNNVHIGNYYLCEQIKIDGDRVDINDPYEDVLEDYNEGKRTDAPTIANCGYLLESDDGYDENCKFTTRHYIPFQFKDDVTDEMLAYVQNKVQGIEDNLFNKNFDAAYADFDLESYIDYWFVQEVTMNGEIKHPKSVYSYIDGEGKLTAGPVWDFDWQTFPVISNISSFQYSYNQSMVEDAKHYRKKSGIPDAPIYSNWNTDAPYMWYPMLFEDATFKAVAAERWSAVAPQLLAYQTEIIKMGQSIATSWEVNQAMWPNNKKVIQSKWGGSHAICGDENYSFEEAYKAMSTTLQTRINGMSFITNKKYPSITIKSK